MSQSYWNDFYHSKSELERPSLFAEEIYHRIHRDCTILELGCGDGRDTHLLAMKARKVFACDYSAKALDRLPYSSSVIEPIMCSFSSATWVASLPEEAQRPDFIYSRFLWHAIPYVVQNRLLDECIAMAKRGIMIECRSTEDSDIQYHYPDHDRWLVRPSDLVWQIEKHNLGCGLVHNKGLAPYKEEDPMILRLTICTKKSS